MKISLPVIPSYAYIAAILIGVPLLVFTFILIAPPVTEQPVQDVFVNKTISELFIQTHQLPKYRPPLHWNQVLKTPLEIEGVTGATDAGMIVFSRKYVDNKTNNIEIIEQVTERVYLFDSFENSTAFYNEKTGQLMDGASDVVFDMKNHASTCRGFYNSTKTFDTITTQCRYGNVAFQVKATSREMLARDRTNHMIGVIEAKF